MRRLFRRWEEDGQTAVEFALAAPFLLMFIFFITDVGFLAYSHITATSAMREGARCAAVGGSDSAVGAKVTDVGGGLAILNGTPTVSRDDTDGDGAADIGDEVTVTANFSYDWLTPVGLVPGLGGTLDFDRDAVMRLETADFSKDPC